MSNDSRIWFCILDEITGLNFYANEHTGQCSWEKPREQIISDKLPEWRESWDKTANCVTYVNSATKASQLTYPYDISNPNHKFPIPKTSVDDQMIRNALVEEIREFQPLDSDWTEEFDSKSGKVMFLNKITQSHTFSRRKAEIKGPDIFFEKRKVADDLFFRESNTEDDLSVAFDIYVELLIEKDEKTQNRLETFPSRFPDKFWRRQKFLDFALNGNNRFAQRQLALVYFKGTFQELPEAVTLLKKAGNSGDNNSQFVLGLGYYHGLKGFTINMDEAFMWFEKSAEQGDPDSQYYLGECFYNGNGIPVDAQKAVEWYMKAAEVGHTDSVTRLASYYGEGERDLWKAAEFAIRAMELRESYEPSIELVSFIIVQKWPKLFSKINQKCQDSIVTTFCCASRNGGDTEFPQEILEIICKFLILEWPKQDKHSTL